MKAEPQTDIQLEANEARKRLQDEISPLLTVFGFVEGRAISLTVTDIIYPNFGQATRSISTRFVQREPPPTKDEVLLKVAWATADPIYRDLLDFFTEAQNSPNPRPTGFKMVERLEQKFGNSEQKKNRTKYKNDGRKNACKELHIRESDLIRLISAYQSKFLGDRHAEYDIDYVPARLESAERAEILTLLKNIIQS